jgi:hypothetical protein
MDTYKVVRPLGKSGVKEFSPAPPVTNLEGRKIGIFWTIFTNGDLLADVLSAELYRRYKRMEVVRLPAGKKVKWGDYPDESIDAVAREAGIDAAIILVGG